MNWLYLVPSVVSGLLGGFVGGWMTAFKMGRWRQRVEDRLERAEQRLENGNEHVDNVPILKTKIETVIVELGHLRRELREDRALLVSRDACDRRHERDA